MYKPPNPHASGGQDVAPRPGSTARSYNDPKALLGLDPRAVQDPVSSETNSRTARHVRSLNDSLISVKQRCWIAQEPSCPLCSFRPGTLSRLRVGAPRLP